MWGRKGKAFPPSPPAEFIAVAHLPTMSITINSIANEKGSISDSNGVGGEPHYGGGGNGVSVLPVHAYTRNSVPQPRVVASSSPLWVSILNLVYVGFPDQTITTAAYSPSPPPLLSCPCITPKLAVSPSPTLSSPWPVFPVVLLRSRLEHGVCL